MIPKRQNAALSQALSPAFELRFEKNKRSAAAIQKLCNSGKHQLQRDKTQIGNDAVELLRKTFSAERA